MCRNFKQLVVFALIILILFVHVVVTIYKRSGFSKKTVRDSTNGTSKQILGMTEKNTLVKGKGKISDLHNENDQRIKSYVLREELQTFDPFTLKTPIPFLPEYKNPCFEDEYGKLYCLPYFFLLASQKSGTTDLYKKLVTHPMISSNKKEYHWWNRARFKSYQKHRRVNFIEYMDRYHSSTKKLQNVVVEGANGQYHPKIFGDGTASTLYDQLEWRNIPQNFGLPQPAVISADVIKHILPKAKFIVILRNPTDRLYSDYNYFNRKNQSSKAFDQKVKEGVSWFQGCLSSKVQNKKSCLYDIPEYVNTSNKMWHPENSWDPVIRIRAGLYSELLSDWFNVFPRYQFYIVTLDQFSKSTNAELEKMYTFLELPKRNNNMKINIEKVHLKTKENLKYPFGMKLSNF